MSTAAETLTLLFCDLIEAYLSETKLFRFEIGLHNVRRSLGNDIEGKELNKTQNKLIKSNFKKFVFTMC